VYLLRFSKIKEMTSLRTIQKLFQLSLVERTQENDQVSRLIDLKQAVQCFEDFEERLKSKS
jgi:hypothetical protein